MTGWFARVLVIAATTQLTVFAIRPLLSYEALALGAGAVDLGVITAAFSVLSLLVAIPLGRRADRHGELPFLVAGAVALLVVPLCLLAPQSIATLAVLSTALGLGQLSAMVGMQTLVARGADAARRDRRFASFTIVTSGGQLLGPVLAGVLADDTRGPAGRAFDGRPAFAAVAAVAAAGLLVAVSLRFAPGTVARRPAAAGTHGGARLRDVMAVPSMANAMLASFTVLASVDLLTAYLPAYGQVHGLPVRTVGFLLATQAAAALVARLGLHRLIRLLSRRRLLAACMLLAAVGLALIPVVTWLPGLFVVMVVTGYGLGLGQPITMGWVAGQARPEVRGTAMSVRLTGNRLGQTVVPALVGGIAGSAGLAAAFLSPAVMLAVAAVLVLRSRVAE